MNRLPCDQVLQCSNAMDISEHVLDTLQLAIHETANLATPTRTPEIWIGHCKHGRHFLSKQPRACVAEAQIRDLQKYSKQAFSPCEEFLRLWVFCQRPVIQIAELQTVSWNHSQIMNRRKKLIQTSTPHSLFFLNNLIHVRCVSND